MSVSADARHLAGCGADVKTVNGGSRSLAWVFFREDGPRGRYQEGSDLVILIAFAAGDKILADNRLGWTGGGVDHSVHFVAA